MTKEELIAMGMTTEQADKVVAKQTEEMKGFVPRARLDEETGKVTALNTQLGDRDKDIKTLQTAAGKGTDLEKQLTELQGKYKTDTEAYQKQLADQQLESALDTTLSNIKTKTGMARARDIVSIKAHIDKTKLKLKDDGTIEGLNAEALVTSKPYLFETETQTDEGPGFNGGSGDGKPKPAQAVSLDDAVASYYQKG